MKNRLLIAICICIRFWATAQPKSQTPNDTLNKQVKLPEVVVSATRSEKPVSELTVPVSVITAKQIQLMGSFRLNDVLGEQTGLVITSDHGKGVQLQGFGADYTLILVDGEPLVGRTAGTLELSRLTVGNIQRIEIMKGPSSALYGSEALAGVINIITEKPREGWAASLRTRYGSNQTADLQADLNVKRGKWGFYGFANRYSTQGYSLGNESAGPTVAPFRNYTFNAKTTYQFNSRAELSVSGRYFTELQRSQFMIVENGVVQGIREAGQARDWNVLPVLSYRLSNRLKATARLYHTTYETRSNLNYQSDGRTYDESFFRQSFTRPEIMAEYFPHARHHLTIGSGYIGESVDATRFAEKKHFATTYAFAQHEWKPGSRLNVVSGIRYDAHSQYTSQFSPKLSAQYVLTDWLKVRASVGRGFKAPDFRQLYLNFSNSVVGYSVFGSQEVRAAVEKLQQQGQLANVLIDPATIGTIRAESSWAYNLGWQLEPRPELKASLNFFRNDIRDLIDTAPIAQKTNGQSVFSYFNIHRVFTQGMEAELSYRLLEGLTLSVGYQYLVAKDKKVVEQLERGEIYRRDPQTLVTERVKPGEYGGLPNRSRHSANLKLFYQHPQKGYTASLRGIYRSRYGFGDLNGNQIIDADHEYVRGYVTWNVSVGKTFRQRLTAQAGVDNLLGYTDKNYVPTLPGRLLYASLGYAFHQRK